MRYAILSDVHANLVAWEQVLADLRTQAPDVLVCLGDVVGYGPKPAEVLRGLRALTDNFVLGNHDAAAAGVLDYSCFNDTARHAIEWTTAALADEDRRFLGSVPLVIDDGDILFVHGEICQPGRFHYIREVADAEENFAATGHFVTFVGHTHLPTLFERTPEGRVTRQPDDNRRLDPACRYIINVGSVGDPRSPGDLRARYVIYDSATREVDFRGVIFSLPAFRNDLAATSLQVTPYVLHLFDQMAGAGGAVLSGPGQPVDDEILPEGRLLTNAVPSARLLMRGAPPLLPGEPDAPKAAKRSLTGAWVMALAALLAAVVVLAVLVWRGQREKSAPPPLPAAANRQFALAETPPPVSLPPTPPPSRRKKPTEAKPPEPEPEPPKPPEAPPREAPAPALAAVSPAPPPEPIAARLPDPVVPARPAGPDRRADEPAAGTDPTVAWWRMEPDSASGPLLDASGHSPLPVLSQGTALKAVAPPVLPCNRLANTGALRLGVWAEPEPSGLFALRPDRSFTLEGWVLLAQPDKPVFLAGTRSGEAADGQGWHIDIRPKSRYERAVQMSFFYDNGPRIVQALSGDIAVADLKPHHFAAVWDHAASAGRGEMRLFLDGELVASTPVPHAGLAPAEANPFRIGSPDNPDRIALDEMRFSHAALRPIEFLRAEPQTMRKDGPWSTAANWSGGSPPTGTETAVIGAGVRAEVAENPPAFAGDLVLMERATLVVRDGGTGVLPRPPAKLVLHPGSNLTCTAKETSFSLVEVAGPATIWGGASTSGHHSRRQFDGEIHGPGPLTLNGVNNNHFILNHANSFTGGLIALSTQNQGFRVTAQAPGSLGAGDVTIEANASLQLAAPGALAEKAVLGLNGVKGYRAPAKLILDADATVAGLAFDGVRQDPGTWGAPASKADHKDERISGNGILTVKP